MMFARKTDMPTTLQPIVSDPNFAAASAETSRLRALADERGNALREVELKIATLIANPDEGPSEARVRAILNGDPMPPREDLESLRARAARFRVERAEFRAAMMIHKSAVASLRIELSGPASAELEPRHRAAVRKMTTALDAMREAAAEEASVRRELADLGFDCHLPDHRLALDLDPASNWTISCWEKAARGYAR